MNGTVFFLLLAACPHDGARCFDARMSTTHAESLFLCEAVLADYMVAWDANAPIVRGACATDLAASPDWWREAERGLMAAR